MSGRVLGIVVAILLSPAARARDAEPMDKYFAVFGDYLLAPDNKHRTVDLADGHGLDLRYGHSVDESIGWEVRAFLSKHNADQPAGDGGHRGGTGASLVFGFMTFGRVQPYAVAGAGLAWSDFGAPTEEAGLMTDAGLGIKLANVATLFGVPIRPRLEIREEYEQFSRSFYDTRIYLGFDVIRAVREDTPALADPVQVVEPAAVETASQAPETVSQAPPPDPAPDALSGDTDGDGVDDEVDRCPGTRNDARVDSEGCEIVKVLTLKGVTFELNSDQLRPESFTILDEAITELNQEYPEARLEIAGHTDSSGSDAYNQDLSERRAKAVLAYLVEHGVDRGRLSAKGYGEAEPVTDNHTADGRAMNRRVELRVKGD